MSRPINKVYIHCSASRYGTIKVIRKWHIKRGFNDIGYHYIILNPFATFKSWFSHHFIKNHLFSSITDGKIEEGRPSSIMGAHCKGANLGSIGICYVGITPTPAQYQALLVLCKRLIKKYQLSIDDILGHHEYYTNNGEPLKKTCPNIDMETFRQALRLAA